MTEEVMASSHADAELAVDDEEEAIRKSNAIDWNSLFATVEDPELAEIMRSAIDSAVSILTTGKEVQKLSVIRTLTELLDTDGEDCIEKVIPLIQNVLKEEATNLDLHCEAAVVFKSIITDKRYDEKFPGLNEKLLNYILLNLENQKEYISAAAWLETLVEIADHIPLQAVTDLIVPLAVNQADPGKRVQRRVIATKLVEKLCTIISPQDVRKELAPCAQMLCQDPNPTVRTSIAQRLSVIAQSLNSSTDCVSLLLPCLIELCKDDDAGVREAILNTIAICLPYFTKESRRTVVVPLLRKCTEQAIFLKDESLGVVSRQLGPWLDSLQDVLSDQERKWFLDTYCRIIGLTMNQSITESLTESRNSSVLISRRMCAYNFPCFVKMYGDVHFTERLLPLLEKLASDSDDEVRSAIAAGFHEIVALRPDEPTLIPPFIELIRGGASEVVDRITGSLHKILPTLYKCANSQTSAPKINRSQLDRIVIGCNRLIRGTGSWRSHESYLNNISCIRHLVPPCDLYISFLPMLKQEVLTARALPCRIAAANTLFLMMREHPMKKSRQTVIDFFCHTIAKHESCQRRRLLLDVVPKILEIFSLEFFKTHILEHVLRLANDKISNIRLQLCRTLPKIKGYLVLPDDENTLLEMEKLVRQLLAAEENPNSRQLIQIYACELSRTETIHRASPANKAKLEEEKRLWTELEPVMIEPPKKEEMSKKEHTTVPSKPPTGSRIPESTGNKPPSMWRTSRTQKPKTAVVRPQPQIVVTQRAPSPMPKTNNSIDDRKSRLPLATNSPLSARYKPQNSATTTMSCIASKGSSSIDPSLSKYRPQNNGINGTSTQRSSIPASTGLRRSATTTTGFERSNGSYSSASKPSPLSMSRSSSSIRRPYSLMKVQSSSAIERKPPQMSIRITSMT